MGRENTNICRNKASNVERMKKASKRASKLKHFLMYVIRMVFNHTTQNIFKLRVYCLTFLTAPRSAVSSCPPCRDIEKLVIEEELLQKEKQDKEREKNIKRSKTWKEWLKNPQFYKVG